MGEDVGLSFAAAEAYAIDGEVHAAEPQRLNAHGWSSGSALR